MHVARLPSFSLSLVLFQFGLCHSLDDTIDRTAFISSTFFESQAQRDVHVKDKEGQFVIRVGVVQFFLIVILVDMCMSLLA